jgi:hypothetical protein
VGIALLLMNCRSDTLVEPSEGTRPDGPAMQASTTAGEVFVGAGQIARCDGTDDEATANLLDNIPGTVYTLGDNVRASGSAADFTNCYGPSWGRHKARTRPAAGDMDYQTSGATGYFGYFGGAAGNPSEGYYSYDLGDWHIVVLNSNTSMVVGSTQERWLKADLAASTKRCTIAMWHTPRFFSSSTPGWNISSSRKILWDDLYAAGAEIVLNGQQHHYERFAPQTPTAVRDDAKGIREFNVGNGGESVGMPTAIANNGEVISTAYGILKLTLGADSYTWEFIPIPGSTFTDSGSGNCH